MPACPYRKDCHLSRPLLWETLSGNLPTDPPEEPSGLSLFLPHPSPLNFHNTSFLFSALFSGPELRGDTVLIYASTFASSFSLPPLIITLIPSLTSSSSVFMGFAGNWENTKVPIPGGDPGPILRESLAYERHWQTPTEGMGVGIRSGERGQEGRSKARRGLPGEGTGGRCKEVFGVENPNHRILGDVEEDWPRLGRHCDGRDRVGSPDTGSTRQLGGVEWSSHFQ